MISYIALFIGGIGTIWTISVLSQLLIRNKDHKRQNKIKAIANNFIPFAAKSYAKDSLEFSFAQALNMLKHFIPANNYKYYLPWYAAIGQEGVGKTTFFKSLQLENSIDSQSFCSDFSQCYWHFFNCGIFLDIKGSLVLQNDSLPSSNETEYLHLISLINKVRPNKGLDGILVFLSLKDLIGPGAKEPAQLLQHAEYLYAQLWKMQKILQLKLPIYVIFTHLDDISGFSEFIQALPGYMKQDVFGWSVPYSLDSIFNSLWIDEMFAIINSRIQYIKSEIFVKQNEDINCKVLEFFANFNKAILPIKMVMERLFQTNAYASGYYLRGIYFVGAENNIKEELNTWPQLPQKENAQNNNLENISYLSHFFATKLVSHKIFLERNLGKLINKASASYLLQVKLMQFFIAAFILSGSLYLSNIYIKLEDSMSHLNSKLSKVFQIIKEHKKEEAMIDEKLLIQNSTILINSISKIFSIKFKFLFVPTTWFSTLEYNVAKMLEKANDLVIFNAIIKNIENKYQVLANSDISVVDHSLANQMKNLSNPLQHQSYMQLCEFISHMMELQQIEQKLNSAVENGNVKSFIWLVNKLIGVEMPKNFYDSANMFAAALKNNSITIPNLQAYKKQIQLNGRKLFESFINQAFLVNNFMEKFNELNKALYAIEKKEKSFTFNNLKNLHSQISNIVTFSNSQEFAWINYSSLHLRNFINLMNNIAKLSLFGDDFENEMQRKTKVKFHELKANFQNIKMPIIGRVFYLDGQEKLKTASGLIMLQGVLNSLFNEVFMQEVDELEIKDIKDGQVVLWDVNLLGYVCDVFDQYDEFITKKIKSYPDHLIDTIKLVINENLNNLIQAKIALAQNIAPIDWTNASTIALANNVRESYGYISSILSRLKTFNLEIYNKLINIEKIRSLAVVQKAEEMLDAENLYSIAQGKILMENLVGGKFYFGMDIGDYLSNQRNRITYFAKEIVDPVIKTLSLIDSLDTFELNYMLKKWKMLIKDVDIYNQGPVSHLFNLEAFIKQSEILNIDDLANLVASKERLYIKTDNYFERKLMAIKLALYNNVNIFINQVIKNNFISLLDFYNKYKKFFPFNLNGEILPFAGTQLFDDLLTKQEQELKVIKKIDPNIKAPNMRFIENLYKINKFLSFLTKPGMTMKMEIKSASAFSELYEKNLQYLVSGYVRSGNNIIYFPDMGSLKIGDKVIFNFKIAKESGMSFGQVKDKTFAISSNEAVITLNKENFIRALLKYTVTKDGQNIIVFELPIIDNDGRQYVLAFPISIELTEEGGVLYEFPEIAINQLAANIK